MKIYILKMNFLKYPDSERSSISDLESFMIQTPYDLMVPVRQVAEFEINEGVANIKRKNRKRAINITADIDLSITTGNNVIL